MGRFCIYKQVGLMHGFFKRILKVDHWVIAKVRLPLFFWKLKEEKMTKKVYGVTFSKGLIKFRIKWKECFLMQLAKRLLLLEKI